MTASVVRLADHEAAVFDTQPDTIDSLPAFEIYLLREGNDPKNAGVAKSKHVCLFEGMAVPAESFES